MDAGGVASYPATIPLVCLSGLISSLPCQKAGVVAAFTQTARLGVTAAVGKVHCIPRGHIVLNLVSHVDGYYKIYTTKSKPPLWAALVLQCLEWDFDT